MGSSPKLFRKIYEQFDAPISRFDCGRICAAINGGDPVCCDTEHAVPVVDKAEWKLLKKRTDLWRLYKPDDAVGRGIVEDAGEHCRAIECKGAAFCERNNRTLACRAFPFFPYFTREDEVIGLSYYWTFEDRCWVISNLQIVDQEFIDQFLHSYEMLFERDEDEADAFREQSTNMRRVFSRWKRPIPIIGRDGSYLKELPKGGGIVKAELSDFIKHEPYRSLEEYRKAVEELDAEVPEGAAELF